MKHVSEQLGVSNQLFSATLLVNEAQPRRVVARLAEALGSLDGATIGVWGLAFKAGTNDTRDSIAMRIVEMLAEAGATTIVYDPSVRVAPLPSRSCLVASALDAIKEADALLTLTAWPEFAAVDATEVKKRIRRGVVIDGCNGLNGAAYAEAGLYYHGVGRPQHANIIEQLSKAVV
jgi:UDPglucose 6-dehydrogenase